MSRRYPAHLGTSGWTYDHWSGRFYPADISRRTWFEYFSQHFDTVELNASFYRIPRESVVASWHSRAPEHFVFSVKMSRLVTHVKKLRNCDHELEWFFTVFKPLRTKIGMYLVQIPPSLKVNHELLQQFCEKLPPELPVTFEFRNKSWYVDETYAILHKYNHNFCIHDMSGSATPRIVTGPAVYLRFHGYNERYGGDYSDGILSEWAEWIEKQRHKTPVYAYFNNDFEGFAVKNCLRLREMVEGVKAEISVHAGP
ncbi:MAG: DUF72 domain-containing protein [Chitinivibrionales bacterium]